jgi:hypothetical protein
VPDGSTYLRAADVPAVKIPHYAHPAGASDECVLVVLPKSPARAPALPLPADPALPLDGRRYFDFLVDDADDTSETTASA